MENSLAEEQFTISADGSDDTPGGSLSEAVRGIAGDLNFRVRSIPAFQLRSGILDIEGDEVIIELGSNLGVVLGEEFAIQRSELLDIGRYRTVTIGLIKVKEVNEDFSIGHLIYSVPEAAIGDQLLEVPRAGFEVTPYVQLLTNLGFDRWVTTFGVRAALDRGFFTLRPFLGFELPIEIGGNGGILPFNIYLGGDLNWYIGRLRIQPGILIGMSIFPFSESSPLADSTLTHVGGKAQAGFSIQLSRDVLLQIDTGYAQWFGLRTGNAITEADHRLLDTYGGIFAGLGVDIKL